MNSTLVSMYSNYICTTCTFPISDECEYKVELLDFYPNTSKSFPIYVPILYIILVYIIVYVRGRKIKEANAFLTALVRSALKKSRLAGI